MRMNGQKETTRERGTKGEQLAARYLKRQGYRILDQNYHSRFGEIDIIAERGDIIAFCEVKTRKDDSFASAMEAVDYKKQHKIIVTASQFLSQKEVELQPRFDVIEVYLEKGLFSKARINHVEGAFTL